MPPSRVRSSPLRPRNGASTVVELVGVVGVRDGRERAAAELVELRGEGRQIHGARSCRYLARATSAMLRKRSRIANRDVGQDLAIERDARRTSAR